LPWNRPGGSQYLHAAFTAKPESEQHSAEQQQNQQYAKKMLQRRFFIQKLAITLRQTKEFHQTKLRTSGK
jgi:hypothetical protein